jgi:hypothetical protein
MSEPKRVKFDSKLHQQVQSLAVWKGMPMTELVQKVMGQYVIDEWPEYLRQMSLPQPPVDESKPKSKPKPKPKSPRKRTKQ